MKIYLIFYFILSFLLIFVLLVILYTLRTWEQSQLWPTVKVIYKTLKILIIRFNALINALQSCNVHVQHTIIGFLSVVWWVMSVTKGNLKEFGDSLVYLSLYSNKLKSIDADLFEHNHNLKSIWLLKYPIRHIYRSWIFCESKNPEKKFWLYRFQICWLLKSMVWVFTRGSYDRIIQMET